MKKIFLTICISALCLTLSAQVTIEATIDSMSILVGEQAHLRIEATAPSSAAIALPEMKAGQVLTGDVEVVEQSPIDTTRLNDGRALQLSRTYTITSFSDHDTLYQLPPLTVKVDSQQYASRTLALKVFTMDVDTLHADQFFGPREIEQPELTWEDVRSVVYMSIAMVLLLTVFAVVLYRYRRGKPIISLQHRRAKRLPPHQVALDEINRIKTERKWADEDSKEYYTLLTDALRRYMSERYAFSAMEMTSDEIIEHLLRLDDVMLAELRELFTTADLVKFAKASTLIGENDMNLVNAITYIQQTKVEVDPNAEPEPEPITTKDREHIMQRRIMLAIMVVAAVAAAVLLAFSIYRLYDLYN